ncbi:augmin complex subunit wac [Drosophila kikkawai]|uniref:Augmin complex subunit wac n=1 Tax=Drosophila kikkawai TaxID=30033 RepID=A0A6P4IKG3_DROKI|nr:augmin complex subunit wac [Drosophila kikkawai]
MENLKLQEEIKELKALGDHYEKQLKLAGIELSDFSSEDMALLDKCVDLAVDSQVHALDLNYLRELHSTKKRDSIENKLIKAKKQIELRKVKSDIDEAARDVAVLERYMSAAEERLIPESEVVQKTNVMLATKQGFSDRQKNFNAPKDFNIEGIIDKVDSLDRR